MKLFFNVVLLALSFAGVEAAEAQELGVEPINEWECPVDHPIKGNETTRLGECIYHIPYSTYYAITKPEVCFATPSEARAYGCRAPLR